MVLVRIVGENCIRTREKERTGFVYRLMVKQSKAKEETLELHGCIKVGSVVQSLYAMPLVCIRINRVPKYIIYNYIILLLLRYQFRLIMLYN